MANYNIETFGPCGPLASATAEANQCDTSANPMSQWLGCCMYVLGALCA
jgi:hypothetical protein